MTGQHHVWEPAMRAALEQAGLAAAGSDVPVGAVVVRTADLTPVAAARNQREASADPTAHAEVLALRAAASMAGQWRLAGHTLVVTLEPCAMCAGAAVLSRIDRVVYAAADPKAGAAGSLWDLLRDRRLNHRPEVLGGVLADEAGEMLRSWFERRRTTKPARAGE